MRTKFKPWAAPYIKEHPEYMITLDDALNLGDALNIEIGSGKGKFIVDMAKKFPHLEFIGVERNVTALGFALKKIVEEEIPNVKMFFGDAFLLMEKVPAHSIKNLFLNFSDPWPKKRHEKRRLTHDNFLKRYYDALDNGGRLIFKTDNSDLFAFSKERIANFDFIVEKEWSDYPGDDDFDAQTEYEINFRSKGEKIKRIILRK